MLYRFEDFELDDQAFELRRSGVPIPIQRQVFETLAYLVRHSDRVVPKEELLAAAWNGTVVGAGSLNQAIWIARKALGDNADAQRFVRTVRGKGFRFVSPTYLVADSRARTDLQGVFHLG
jgi:DNA-binding winged helix-turn-helix (wHTH) protein